MAYIYNICFHQTSYLAIKSMVRVYKTNLMREVRSWVMCSHYVQNPRVTELKKMTRLMVFARLYTEFLNLCIQDSFESKTSNPTAEMGSTSYIIPLRSESDVEDDTEPEPLPLPPAVFRNKVTPISLTTVQTEQMRSVQSRSPLFRAKSREYDRSLSDTENHIALATTAIDSTEMFVHNESGTAKIKRSIFSNKSNSASASGSSARRPIKPNRSTSAKSSMKS